MTPFFQRYVPEDELQQFKKIRAMVEALPDIDLGKDEKGEEIILSCHMLARAISRVTKLKCRDGLYQHFWDHSWLVTKQGNLIDVYPIGMLGGPLLVSSDILIRGLYCPQDLRCKDEFLAPSFKRAVNAVTKALRKLTPKG